MKSQGIKKWISAEQILHSENVEYFLHSSPFFIKKKAVKSNILNHNIAGFRYLSVYI